MIKHQRMQKKSGAMQGVQGIKKNPKKPDSPKKKSQFLAEKNRLSDWAAQACGGGEPSTPIYLIKFIIFAP